MRGLAILTILLLLRAAPVGAAQTHYTQFEVASSQVPSAQTDFPAVISWCDARIRHTGDGGHVASTSGFDLRPYSDSDLSTALTYELVFYSSDVTEGCVELWVAIASIDVGSDVFLGYGDPALTSDGSGDPWPSPFSIVSHYADGTTLSVADSSGNGNDGTNNGSVAPAAGTLDGGAEEDATANRYVSYTASPLSGVAAATVSIWANPNTLPATINVLLGPSGFQKIGIQNSGTGGGGYVWVDYPGTSSLLSYPDGTITASAWQLLHLVYDGSLTGNTNRIKLFVDGSPVTLTTVSGTVPATLDTGTNVYQVSNVNSGWPDWVFDEFHVATSALSDDWKTTEYNNQVAPGSGFWTVGSEVEVGGGGGVAGSALPLTGAGGTPQ